MPLGLNIVLNADGSKAVANIGMVQNAMNQLANTARGELTQKMKMIFSAAAIEQAAQRTGEWAQQLTQTARAMGVTNEVLQTLNILASKTNTPKDAVVSMFENIDKARQEALKGNIELQTSFQRLGVSLQDLRTKTKSQLFGQVMSNIPANVMGAGMKTRQDVQGITGGTPENFIEAIRAGIGAKGFEAYKEQQVTEGGVIPEGQVDELSKTWGDFMTDLIEVGNDLKPLAGILIVLFRDIVNAIGAVIDVIKSVFDILSGDSAKMEEGFKRVGGILAGMGLGVVKFVTSIVDMIKNILLSVVGALAQGLNKMLNVVGMGKSPKELSEDIKKVKDKTNMTDSDVIKNAEDFYRSHTNERAMKRGQGIAMVTGVLATGGESALGRLAAGPLATTAKAFEKIGMQAPSLNAAAEFAKNLSTGRASLFGKESLMRRATTVGKEDEFFSSWSKFESKIAEEAVEIGKARGVPMGAEEFKAFFDRRIAQMMAGASSIAAAAAYLPSTQTQVSQQKRAVEPTPILPSVTTFGSAGAGETGMMKIGGVFGSNFQSKMIALNTEMVKLLSQISTNTMGRAAGDKYSAPSSQVGGGF